ncbi:uncharacterized protein LOC143461204 [Clavelina lepadiformis]|uniref:uncharacterized protein LOC143461204 n=1 Tax=Clavelina lepadiformis TaxID=159417 RepID=UPI004042935C
MPEIVHFGLTTVAIKKKFNDLVKKQGCITKAITHLLNRDKYLTSKYRFRSLANCEVWEETAEYDTMQSITPVLQMLDSYVRFNRLESRSAAIEELLYAPRFSDSTSSMPSLCYDSDVRTSSRQAMGAFSDTDSIVSSVYSPKESVKMSAANVQCQTKFHDVTYTPRIEGFEHTATQTDIATPSSRIYANASVQVKVDMIDAYCQTDPCVLTNQVLGHPVNALAVQEHLPIQTFPANSDYSVFSMIPEQTKPRVKKRKKTNFVSGPADVPVKSSVLGPVATTTGFQQHLPTMKPAANKDLFLHTIPSSLYATNSHFGYPSANLCIFSNSCQPGYPLRQLPSSNQPTMFNPRVIVASSRSPTTQQIAKRNFSDALQTSSNTVSSFAGAVGRSKSENKRPKTILSVAERLPLSTSTGLTMAQATISSRTELAVIHSENITPASDLTNICPKIEALSDSDTFAYCATSQSMAEHDAFSGQVQDQLQCESATLEIDQDQSIDQSIPKKRVRKPTSFYQANHPVKGSNCRRQEELAPGITLLSPSGIQIQAKIRDGRHSKLEKYGNISH